MKVWGLLQYWKHYTKLKKSDTEDHIVYDSISVKCPE